MTGSRSIRELYETAGDGLFGDIGLRKRVGVRVRFEKHLRKTFTVEKES